MKINTNTCGNIERNKTYDCSVIVLNIPKGSLFSEKPNPVNNSLNNEARNVGFFGRNRRPGKEENKRRGGSKLPT